VSLSLAVGIQGLGVAMTRGTGRQKAGAFIIFFGQIVIALPIGVPLMFGTHLGLAGNNCNQFCT